MQRPIWKSGPHNVYIARDKTKDACFKIGMTGYELEFYRKKLCHRVHGRRSHDTIVMRHSWHFQEFWAAWYVEQTTIALIKRFGFEQVREGDWFSIDEPCIEVVWEIVHDLAYDIREWETANNGLKCDPKKFSRWERALAKMGRIELSRRANAENLPPRLRPSDLRPIEQ